MRNALFVIQFQIAQRSNNNILLKAGKHCAHVHQVDCICKPRFKMELGGVQLLEALENVRSRLHHIVSANVVQKVV